jgi:hypothetical protein
MKASARSTILITIFIFAICYGILEVALKIPYAIGISLILSVIFLLFMIKSSLKETNF